MATGASAVIIDQAQQANFNYSTSEGTTYNNSNSFVGEIQTGTTLTFPTAEQLPTTMSTPIRGRTLGDFILSGRGRADEVSTIYPGGYDINPQIGNNTALIPPVIDDRPYFNVTTKVNPNDIELSHPAKLGTPFSDPRHGTVGELAEKLSINSSLADKIPPIEVAKIKGTTYSANNRRLRAFQEAGVDVRTVPASKEQVRKIKQRLQNKRK